MNRVFYRDLIEHDHVYTDSGDDEIGLMMRSSFKSGLCPICVCETSIYQHIPEDQAPPEPYEHYAIMQPVMLVCGHCGWWQSKAICVTRSHPSLPKFKGGSSEWAYSYHPVIEQVDITSNKVAIADMRQHLLKNWEDRKLISAGKAESLVKSLLKEHLKCDVFSSTANVNKPDGGIDLFVAHENGEVKAAVQVKRRITKDVEPVTEVRNFVGALAIENIQKGIFVTTAERYSSVARDVPEKLNNRLELELISGNELFDILKCFTKPDDLIIPPYVKADMVWQDNCGNLLKLEEILNV
ncbi:TPA: restriction endonuclease [Vibrio vulnificus]